MADELDNFRSHLETAVRTLQSDRPERHVSSVSDLYRDILALREEFEEVEIDLGEHQLSVTTDRIVLEDIHLGRFDIRLNWRRLGSSSTYRVVALDPNPASKCDDITHPHVQDERLCEGEGHIAIRGALAEGRLYDFFLLVSQVLDTYGQGSAYVELANWTGSPCEDCGSSVGEDDSYYCRHCDRTLCSDCSVSCQGCNESCCSGCLQQCAGCGLEYCSSCLATCPVCRKRFCEDCREAGLCQSCHKKKQEEDHDHASSKDKSPRRRPVAIPA